MNLNVNGWREYRFGDLISDIYKSKSINKNDLLVANEFKRGIRYITRTAENNGCEMLADKLEVPNTCVERANAITIGDTTATCFYQDEEFITGDHMVIVRADEWLNKYTAMYVLTILNNEQYKYSYGRAFLMDRIKNTVLKLPSDSNNNPDWNYVERFIKSLYYKRLTTKNEIRLVYDLDISEWKDFSVASILKIYNGKGITKEEIAENEGNFIVVQSGETNNGVIGKIDKLYCYSVGYTLSEKPCLTVARSGSAGFVSFQSEGCVVGDSAKILLLDDDLANIYVYMFLQTILTANRFKYAYGRKVTESKYMNDTIKLPIQHNKDGMPYIDVTKRFSERGYVPDWTFMENYIKTLPYGDRI